MTQTMTHTPTVTNVLDTYSRATLADLDYGREWYRTAHALAVRLDPRNPARGAGVIAALSPLMGWERNMMLAIRAFEDGEASGALFRNVEKANRILAGEDPMSVLGGLKVRNFYLNILDPSASHGVCIDRHAHDIAVGRFCTDNERVNLTPIRYEIFAQVYRAAAEQAGISPCEMQAITWTTWRRERGLEAQYGR